MSSEPMPNWHFIDDQGTFKLESPHTNSYLYFPLVNHAGMMSSLTPALNGDAKINQNAFLLLPVSVEDLHNTRSARNFWVRIRGQQPWSVTGNSAAQICQEDSKNRDEVSLRAGFLWHEIHRRHTKTGLAAETLNFVPASEDTVELMKVTLKNEGREPLGITPIAAIPIYGRSADNLRDHRHVTALLHRTQCHPNGVLVKPTMSFDERGHQPNTLTYAVLGVDGEGNPPGGFTPVLEDFIGEGGSLDWPQAVIEGKTELKKVPAFFSGMESVGALHFPNVTLAPGEYRSYILLLGILDEDDSVESLLEKYGSEEKFSSHLRKTREYWLENVSKLQFNHHQERRDGWLQWVTLQPVLRQIMGNSFLPYHDYGRGGRGWRDLWQDLLGLILTDQPGVDGLLLSNFAGVRMDGSNATIVGSSPGEFKADRNSIPRVWMDHGAWPLLTTKLYLDWTGDISFLLDNQTYFQDHLFHRCQKVDQGWDSQAGTLLKTASGEVVKGSVLEHLLVQHLTEFFNVGEHNMIRLEGGDWNDGLDMAAERGESVAFSAMYAGNLRALQELCLELAGSGVEEAEMAEELLLLLDSLADPVDYESISAKQERLDAYFDAVSGLISGRKVIMQIRDIAGDLQKKSDWLATQIRDQEWLGGDQPCGWFNGYYDNLGRRVEGREPDGVRMTLTGQVFPLMAGVATPKQAKKVVGAVNRYLFDHDLQGYRLNTDFGPDLPKLGRAFSFAYGHKENGAVFSHMAVMYAYALYQQGLAKEAWRVLDGLYQQSQDFPVSRIYPGIPEYFNPRGRGMYPYLTGSAPWYIFTLLTETFGIKGQMGDLCLAPKLDTEQFSSSEQVSVKTSFTGKRLSVVYRNPDRLSYGAYCIGAVSVNDRAVEVRPGMQSIQFPRDEVDGWPQEVRIEVDLIEK